MFSMDAVGPSLYFITTVCVAISLAYFGMYIHDNIFRFYETHFFNYDVLMHVWPVFGLFPIYIVMATINCIQNTIHVNSS